MLLSSERARRSPGRALRRPGLALGFLLLPLCAIIAAVVLALRVQPAAPAAVRRACAGPVSPCTGRQAWQRTSLTLEVDALTADPARPGRLLAGTASGLWSSTNGGLTWAADRGMPEKLVILAFASASGDRALFAGTGDGTIYARSTDAGDSWRRISPPLGSANPIFGLAADSQGRILLAGTVGGVYRGEEHGGAWRWRRVAATGDSAVGSIVWQAGDPRRAYASVFGTWPPVLRTTDGGLTWRADARGLPGPLPSVALLAAPPGSGDALLTTMGGGVWLRDPGGLWRDAGAGLPEYHAMAVTSGAGALYAGTMGSGVYMRYGDAAWRRIGRGLEGGGEDTVLALAYVGGARPSLLAGTALGVFRLPFTG